MMRKRFSGLRLTLPTGITAALVLTLLVCGLTAGARAADEGYDLWLRYRRIADRDVLSTYRDRLASLHCPGDSRTLRAARKELVRGLEGLLGQAPPRKEAVIANALVIGTPGSNPAIAEMGLAESLKPLGKEGFLIRSASYEERPVTVIAANTDLGALYGAFGFLRHLQQHKDIASIDMADRPRLRYRVLNHWDSINGIVSRGYAGRSLWKWHELPETVSDRYTDYARACASVGINMTVLNGSYAGAKLLESEYIDKTAAIAAAMRPYGVRVAIHPSFAGPMVVGGLDTANPEEPAVQKWWRDKASEFYSKIPDFGGFMVKADSEGTPGPHTYNLTHAHGANLLADAVAPHGGIVMWRAFGVFDRKNTAYPGEPTSGLGLMARPGDLFNRIDGWFKPNVFLQVKNGPRDFQPREPFHPLLAAMKKTPVMMEVQITQEYFGHSTHLVYLAPVWKEVLDTDTFAAGEGSTVRKLLDGTIHDHGDMTGIAGVANTGTDENWTGHLFAQANWYAFGRVAWNPRLTSRDVAREWIKMTFSTAPDVIETIEKMMMGSRRAAVDYMTPLGLFQLNDNRTTSTQRSHYAPQPSRRTGHHNAKADGIGGSWLAKGLLKQYPAELQARYGDPETCPEKYLLWFHHVSWDRKLSTGRTVWEELCYRYIRGVEYVRDMQEQWKSLEGKIDPEQWKHVRKKLIEQEIDAQVWRDECLIHFRMISRRPIPQEILDLASDNRR